MKIVNLEKRTENGYSFSLQLGPFIVDNFWYNTQHNNITPPARYNGDKRYPLVRGAGIHFKRVRDCVAWMVQIGRKSFNSETEFALFLPPLEEDVEDDSAVAA